MIGRIIWLAGLLAIAVVTIAVQLDRQAAMNPELARLVPGPFRAYSQTHLAAAASEGTDPARALEETRTLVRRRPVPAEHLSLLAVAQTKAGMEDAAVMSVQIAAQRGWREPLAQEAVLRMALAAGDRPEAARRYAALFLRAETPDELLREVGPEVLEDADGAGQRTLVDIVSGTDRWQSLFLRRGAQVMPPATFTRIVAATMAEGTRYDCAALSQAQWMLVQRDPAATPQAAREAAACSKQ